MDGQEQNATQSQPADTGQQADNATAGAEITALAPELGPNGLPINPPAGEEGAEVDSNFLLDTFFGEGTAPPPKNSAEGQTKGSNSVDGQSKEGSLAPPQAAPAANAGEGSPKSGPSSEQQTGQKEQQGGTEAPAQTPGQGNAQPSPEAPPAAPQLSVEDRLKLASADALAQQNRQLLERLAALEKGQQPQGQQQQQSTGQQPAEGQEPPLRLVVPDPLFDAMFNSDDPQAAKQAVSLLITAVAQNAVNAAIAKVPALIDQRMQAVTQAIEGGKKVSEMETQYFDRFPAHNNQLFRPLIQQVVDEKFKLFPHAQWDETMMDAVGATVNEKLKALGIDPSTVALQPSGSGQQEQQGKQNGNGQAQQQPRQKPAAMLDGSTRAENKVPHDAGDFIRGTFA